MNVEDRRILERDFSKGEIPSTRILASKYGGWSTLIRIYLLEEEEHIEHVLPCQKVEIIMWAILRHSSIQLLNDLDTKWPWFKEKVFRYMVNHCEQQIKTIEWCTSGNNPVNIYMMRFGPNKDTILHRTFTLKTFLFWIDKGLSPFIVNRVGYHAFEGLAKTNRVPVLGFNRTICTDRTYQILCNDYKWLQIVVLNKKRTRFTKFPTDCWRLLWEYSCPPFDVD